MNLSRTVLLCCLLSTAALAQVPGAGSADSAPPAVTGETLPLASVGPGRILARGSVDTDILLLYVDLGVAADVGMVPMGPGTIAVGAGIDYGFCGTFCLATSALTPITLGRRYFTPHARLTYHFNLKNDPNLDKLDLYGVVLAGMTWASMNVTADDQSAFLDSHSLSVMGGLGVGGNYFLNDRVFVGAEARLRYSQGTYASVGTVGGYTMRDEEKQWSLSGANVVFFAGLRI